MSGTENAPAMPRLLSSPPARVLPLQPVLSVLLLLLSLVLGSLPRPVQAEPAPSSPVTVATAPATSAALPASGDLLEALPPPAAGPPVPPRQAAPARATDSAADAAETTALCTALTQRCELIETDTQARARQRQELERLQRQIEQTRRLLDDEQRQLDTLRQQADRELRELQGVRRQLEVNRREIERHLQRQALESEQLEQEQLRSAEELRRHATLAALREHRLLVAGLIRASLELLRPSAQAPRPDPDPGRLFMHQVAESGFAPVDVQQLLRRQLARPQPPDSAPVRDQLATRLGLMQRHLAVAERIAAALRDPAQRARVQDSLKAEQAAHALLRRHVSPR
ncbi:hypothetical protein X805_08150 [Sphaerotilus natans subsp. natans DSM 6575]|uniref:Uncharacterized protein n=1 Tax=Sphaerotilus natans subsp. natans DSM 6575 TaxID=1286631 RepID=A0A059KQY7_9BURK|nr:hypothetical protein X805_08150 [Sphaerotilus natans subsp. natans DSM 6575]SIR57141.1 hypothetical protein SAMN05421778_11266 [Sphaerotilus natans]